MHPTAGHRELYLLVAGLLLGLLAGPWVLGRAAPDFYARTFVGGTTQLKELAQTQHELALRRAVVLETKSETVLADFELEAAAKVRPLIQAWEKAKLERSQELQRIMSAVALAIACIMGLEALLLGQWQHRAMSARYALMALWLAMLLAQPAMLAELPMVLVLLLVLVAGASVLLPLKRTA